MFAFGRIVNYTKASVSWQQPRFFFSSSTKAANHWSKIPEIRRKQYDRQNASWREQYAQDKAFREKRAKQSLESKRALSAYESYVRRRRNAFFKWVISSLNRGVRRTWPTHTPEISLVNKTRRCTECDFDRHKTLWWKRNGTHDSFDVRYDCCWYTRGTKSALCPTSANSGLC